MKVIKNFEDGRANQHQPTTMHFLYMWVNGKNVLLFILIFLTTGKVLSSLITIKRETTKMVYSRVCCLVCVCWNVFYKPIKFANYWPGVDPLFTTHCTNSQKLNNKRTSCTYRRPLLIICTFNSNLYFSKNWQTIRCMHFNYSHNICSFLFSPFISTSSLIIIISCCNYFLRKSAHRFVPPFFFLWFYAFLGFN